MKLNFLALNIFVAGSVSFLPSWAYNIDHPDVAKLDRAGRLIQQHHYKEGYTSFKKMAKNGCPYSQCVVGMMHQSGVGAERDLSKAAYWFEKSAAQGFYDADRRLGELYLNPKFRNEEKALQHLKIAASHGIAEAQYDLGKFYHDKGGQQAMEQAQLWLQRAAAHGVDAAKQMVAELPPVPQGATSPEVSNLQTAWSGYAAVANSLQSNNSNY